MQRHTRENKRRTNINIFLYYRKKGKRKQENGNSKKNAKVLQEKRRKEEEYLNVSSLIELVKLKDCDFLAFCFAVVAD